MTSKASSSSSAAASAAAAAAMSPLPLPLSLLPFQDKRNRNPNWTDAEIVRFLEMLEEDGHVRDLVANRNKKVFCEIAQRLVNEGADKTWDQCRIKLKNLKSQYRYVKERIPNIDELDMEDDAVVRQLISECQARSISPSSIKHLRFLLRFLNKHKLFTALAVAGDVKNASPIRMGASSGGSTPKLAPKKPVSKDEGISPPASPHPGLRLISSGGGSGDLQNVEDDAGYKLIEQFNREMMDQFMEHQRKTRESFEQWEQERWRQEKECMERWKQEGREHERQLFGMFCTAMVKCNAALTAVLQSRPIPEPPQQPSAQAIANQLLKRSAINNIGHEVTIKRLRPNREEDEEDESPADHDEVDEDGDEAYEMQQEIQNMVQVTMDVQDSEIQC